MTEPTTKGSEARIPASLQRRTAASTSGAKILALGASVAAGISLVGAMAVGAHPDAVAVPAAQEQVIVVRVQAPSLVSTTTAPVSTSAATPVPAPTVTVSTTAPAPAPPPPTTVSEGS